MHRTSIGNFPMVQTLKEGKIPEVRGKFFWQ